MSKNLPLNFKKRYFDILLALVPISFILGNTIINLNFLFLIISALLVFKLKIFKTKYYIFDKIIISFFFLILITGIYNDFHLSENYSDLYKHKGSFATTLKSLSFFRFIILYFTLRFLIENKIINLKYFFISSSFFVIFVSLDVIYQFYFGKDIFGFESPFKRKFPGPFNDEAISGGYIQKFSFFAFFLIPFFFKENLKKYYKLIIFVLFLIFSFSIVLTGNRMPALLFFLSIVLVFIFINNLKKYLFKFLISLFIVITLAYNFSYKVKMNFGNMKFQIIEISRVLIFKKPAEKEYVKSPYLREFQSSFDTWRLHKYIGGGIKNFRYYCHFRQNIHKNSSIICNMHPHNYYLEILTETGLVGILIITCFLASLFYTMIKRNIFKNKLYKNNLFVVFFILFLIEIFPIKSTGSLFTTNNATYFFLILGLLIGLLLKKKSLK
ncbi:MAG: hypothetical protein CBE46_000145 [Candidatus Pelagibacter sp. TMED286]|nr:MAG: hypothetical protein CBE46_000145 [Candidatus Pelagibacter sp. TMED286]